MNRDGSGDQDDVVKWLGLAVGLHEDVVTEATPRLRSEQVYVVSDLALLVEEGGLSDVFTTRVSARKVRDALRLRSAAQPATVDCPAGGRSRAAAEQEVAVEAAVEVALVPSTPRGAPPGGAEAEEVTPPAAPHKAAAPLAGRRAGRRLLFGDQCAAGGEGVVASGGPAAPVPLAALRTATPSAAVLRLQAAVRGWLMRRVDVGVEPLWLQEAAVLLAADGGYADAAEVDGAAGATGAADAAVSALLALLGHGEEDEPRWLLEAAAGGLVSCEEFQLLFCAGIEEVTTKSA